MQQQKYESTIDLTIEPVAIEEIEACERQVEIDWFPGDWQICLTTNG